ncbi:MAG TPA: hypothetical protein VFQ67_14385 [Allosphingosinicella sp.]|jgi:hypothetical protein|nr:hypothetical protein [Allosphingosinicella sp.]
MAYELPTETGEQRLQRLRDRNHLWQQRAVVGALLVGGALWFGKDVILEEGWSWSLLWLLAIPPLYLLVEGIWEVVFAPVEWLLGAIFRPIFRPLSSRGYSYYDEEEREEPAPDYSMAEVIVDEEDPQPLPEEEEEDRR